MSVDMQSIVKDHIGLAKVQIKWQRVFTYLPCKDEIRIHSDA